MKKAISTRNVRVFAENNGNKDGFSIYLNFSGQQEFVVYHRHNALLYSLLCDGVYLDDLRRWKPKASKRQVNRQLVNLVSHSLKVIDDYITERQIDKTLRTEKASITKQPYRSDELRYQKNLLWAS